MADNNHIKQALKDYYNQTYSPEYAILVKGEWGCGKTTLVTELLEHLSESVTPDEDVNYIYVSLYGTNSYKEIEDEIFSQLHPLLSSKKARLAAKVAKGLLKTTLRIDLDDDGKPEGSISSQIPDINLPEYLTNTDGYILIFDDLERSAIEICSLLGYLNYFVEHLDHKVVIIANEKELLNDESSDYEKIKEKLIGRELEVSPEINIVLDLWTNELEHKGIFARNKDSIISVFKESKTQNLRLLKRGLHFFQAIIDAIPEDAADITELHDHLLKIYLILFFETKSGHIQPVDLKKLKSAYYKSIDQCDEVEKKLKSMREKYPSVDFYNLILDSSVWITFLQSGRLDKATLDSNIGSSIYMLNKIMPTWKILWHYYEIDDDTFGSTLHEVESKFDSLEYCTNFNVLKHVTGMLMNLSKLELLTTSTQKILDKAKENFDLLISNDNLAIDITGHEPYSNSESYDSLGFQGMEIPHYQDFVDYTSHKIENYKDRLIPQEISMLSQELTTDPITFCSKLYLNESGKSRFYDFPILKDFPSDQFVQACANFKKHEILALGTMFEKRYQYKEFNLKISAELSWLVEIRQHLLDEISYRKNKPSGYRLKVLLKNNIEPALRSFFQSTTTTT